MFIKSLKISGKNGVIRYMVFQVGLNLIIDNTFSNDKKETGNNVGKTTVLKLIHFCLGAKASVIYYDDENKKEIKEVKDFLVDNEVLITLKLVSKLNDIDAKDIIIKRNFLLHSKKVLTINGGNIASNDFEQVLKSLLFTNCKGDNPTFKQIIGHNIRYEDYRINNTLKLNPFTSGVQYESLYLFLFNCNFNDGAEKEVIIKRIREESLFKGRLESDKTKNQFQVMLSLINDNIKGLTGQKSILKLNPDLEKDIDAFNIIKYKLSKFKHELSKLEMRKNIVVESKKNLEDEQVNIDLDQLRSLYNQAKCNISDLQKTFEDLCEYHNKMITKKLKFITDELPLIEEKIGINKEKLRVFSTQEKELAGKIEFSDSFDELEIIIVELNNKYQLKGEYESKIEQIKIAEDKILEEQIKLDSIDADLFSEEFDNLILSQLNKFNVYFSKISKNLYGEEYAIGHEQATDKNGNKFYKFTCFNINVSSGKKQGEIISFDIAYMLFSESENMPYLHFLLNDKKELMHDNQLLTLPQVAEENNVQLIVSMLRDKLPSELNKPENFLVELSQDDKLFRF